MIFFDTETVGLHGVAVLIQWAEDDGPIQLFCPWTEPIWKTLELIEMIANHPGGVCGFNLAFDWFHLCKLYTIFSSYHDRDAIPEEIIDELGELEMDARDGPCLKPVKACDIMLVARKGPYQSTMDRGDVRIRRVPTALAWQLASELEKRIKLKDIYFARKKDKGATKWQVFDIEYEGEVDPNFKDIVLKFAPSSALKALAVDALNLPPDDVLLFHDIEVDPKFLSIEFGYAPFAKAAGGNRHNWRGAWPEMISHHIAHWMYHDLARKYAAKDVEYTRDLYKHFGSPLPGDDDSELACMVGAVRWRGFTIDVPKLRKLREEAIKRTRDVPTAPAQVRYYVNQELSATEQLVLRGSTKKIVLENIAKLTIPCPECNSQTDYELITKEVEQDLLNEEEQSIEVLDLVMKTQGRADCPKCNGSGKVLHKCAERAQEVLAARAAIKEIELYDKLLLAGRFHVSLKVIGALSGRMSGADKLNPQGIKKTKEVRSCFPLAHPGTILCGGDFAGFEVTIAEAVYNDPNLRKMLMTCEGCRQAMEFVLGPQRVADYLNVTAHANYMAARQKDEAKKAKKDPSYKQRTTEEIWEDQLESDFICPHCGSKDAVKIHALFGLHAFPEYTYETLKATSGTKDDKYTRAKSGVFAMLYGGTEHTLADRLGVPIEIGKKALASFHKEFPGVKRFQQDIANAFCSMRQVDGIGSKVEWHEPADYRETMLGFRRYFTLENKICFALFSLAENPPAGWRDTHIKVMRRDREQTATGAVQSALFAAAFQIQAGNMRAASNHDIQSFGATMTKSVQRAIWDLQPAGVGKWLVQPMNIHDEIQCPCDPSMVAVVKARVNEAVEGFRPKVPLVKMDWSTHLQTWADKS